MTENLNYMATFSESLHYGTQKFVQIWMHCIYFINYSPKPKYRSMQVGVAKVDWLVS
jgi:hypothetical protein